MLHDTNGGILHLQTKHLSSNKISSPTHSSLSPKTHSVSFLRVFSPRMIVDVLVARSESTDGFIITGKNLYQTTGTFSRTMLSNILYKESKSF